MKTYTRTSTFNSDVIDVSLVGFFVEYKADQKTINKRQLMLTE